MNDIKEISNLNINDIKFEIDKENKLLLIYCSSDEKFDVNSILKVTFYIIDSGLRFDKESIKLISKNIKPENINIDPKILTDTFTKIMLSENPSIWIEALREMEILKHFLPELLEGYECEQNEYHLYDVYYHLLNSCNAAIPRLDIRMAALFHDIGKPRTKNKKVLDSIEKNTFYAHEIVSTKMFRQIAKRFLYNKKFVKKVSKLIRYHMFHYTIEWTDSAVRRFIKNIGNDFMEDLFLLRDADRKGSGKRPDKCGPLEKFKKRIKEVIKKDTAPKVTDLVINGKEIISHYNMKEGPIIGELLKYLLSKYIENPTINNKETLYKLLDEYLKKI